MQITTVANQRCCIPNLVVIVMSSGMHTCPLVDAPGETMSHAVQMPQSQKLGPAGIKGSEVGVSTKMSEWKATQKCFRVETNKANKTHDERSTIFWPRQRLVKIAADDLLSSSFKCLRRMCIGKDVCKQVLGVSPLDM